MEKIVETASVHFNETASRDRLRGASWLASLSQLAGEDPNLNHSLDFYTLYALTGDEDYLQRCEEFLQETLDAR